MEGAVVAIRSMTGNGVPDGLRARATLLAGLRQAAVGGVVSKAALRVQVGALVLDGHAQ
ncbi:hypothetical protein GCM10010349_65860 [Streptomyces flavofungini]|nr:hypothetical protein GCM10010349_65860 [Streptomyces flavofungini]